MPCIVANIMPTTAQAKARKISTAIFKSPWEAIKPAVKSKLSPGRKKPINNPDSAKIIAQTPK